MRETIVKTSYLNKALGILAASLLLGGTLAAATLPRGQQPAPDNTKTNQGDAGKDAVTADQQGSTDADRQTTRQIRKALMKDSSLSTYAHNIKIITRNGRVTLRGPVRTEDERAGIEAKAAAVAGAENVRNKLTVAPAKSGQ
jgi:osmotically-inducible protein OsmY